MQVNAAAEGAFEDVEVAWGGQPVPRQVAEFKFKQVCFACSPTAMFRSFLRRLTQEMDTRLEYDKAKAVKWLMAPGLVEISAQEIADALNERRAREISRFHSLIHSTLHLSVAASSHHPPSLARRKAEERAASRAVHDSGPSAVKVASMVRTFLKLFSAAAPFVSITVVE
jgi:hypothetical protein